MRLLAASLFFLMLGNSAWAGYTKMPVTDFSAGNAGYSGGTCTMDIKSFGSGFTFDIWIKPPGEFGVSKHVEIFAKSGPYAPSLPPEMTRAVGFNTQEDVSYAGRMLTLRQVSVKWNGQENDPKYFRYTRFIEMDIVGGIDLGTVSSLKYTFTNESAGEATWTEWILCEKRK